MSVIASAQAAAMLACDSTSSASRAGAAATNADWLARATAASCAADFTWPGRSASAGFRPAGVSADSSTRWTGGTSRRGAAAGPVYSSSVT